MLDILQQFRDDIERVRTLGALYDILSQQITSALDLTDLLRSQIVMAVSALDHYIHEITRVGMLEVYGGKRPQTPAFLRFQVTDGSNTGKRIIAVQAAQGDNRWLDEEIRTQAWISGFSTSRQNSRCEFAFFLLVELWDICCVQKLNLKVEDVKKQL